MSIIFFWWGMGGGWGFKGLVVAAVISDGLISVVKSFVFRWLWHIFEWQQFVNHFLAVATDLLSFCVIINGSPLS